MSMLRGVDERREMSPGSHHKKQKGQPYQLKHSPDDHNRTDDKFSKVIKVASLSHPAQEDTRPSIADRVRNDNIWLGYPLFENNDYSSRRSTRCRNEHRQRQTTSTLDCLDNNNDGKIRHATAHVNGLRTLARVDCTASNSYISKRYFQYLNQSKSIYLRSTSSRLYVQYGDQKRLNVIGQCVYQLNYVLVMM
jgi:hypothetical protein